MALFTDGNPGSVESLKAYESSVVNLAQRECIDLQVKLGLAYEEMSEWIFAYLLDRPSIDPQSPWRRGVGLRTLVVDNPLRRWHVLHTLELTYRDAHHGQLNDRYKPNWMHYRKAAQDAREVCFRTGLGFVQNPLPRPNRPRVESQGGLWTAGLYRTQIDWVNAAGQMGAPSEPVSIEQSVNSGLKVSLASMPDSAVGWNVYVGFGDSPVTKQNNILLTDSEWVSAGEGPTQTGASPGTGQQAEMFLQATQVRL